MNKKILFLCAAIVALTAVSCGSEGGTSPQSNTPSSSAQGSGEAQSGESSSMVYDIPEPELPEMDYGGAKFIVYTPYDDNESSETSLFPPAKFLFSEALNGEIVNDTVFNRNLTVEQKFNVKFEIVQNESRPDVMITAGEPMDVVCWAATGIADDVYTGAYMNMYDFPYLSLNAEYWSPSCVKGTIVDDRVYFMPCDVNLDPLANSGFLYFNKRLLAEHDLVSPYDLVHEDRWTFDTFLDMVRQVHSDLNGDGVMDMEDLYGCLHKGQWGNAAFFQFYFGAGQIYTKTDPDQGRVLALNSEVGETIIQKLWDVLMNRSYCMDDLWIEHLTDTSHWDTPYYPLMFVQGQCLFIQEGITAMDYFRSMDDDFGLVPNPKYDSNQKEYYTRVSPDVAMFCLPATLEDPEKTGAIMEYWAWLSHYTVLPSYYEITIKQKRTRDEDAIEMLDIIRTTPVYEFSEIYYTHIRHYAWDAWGYHSFTNRVMSNEKFLSKRIASFVRMIRSLND